MRIKLALVAMMMVTGCSNVPSTKETQDVAGGDSQNAPIATHNVVATLSAIYMGADAPISTCMGSGGTLTLTNNGRVRRNDRNGNEIRYRNGEAQIRLGSHYAIEATANNDMNCKLNLSIHADGKLVFSDENRHISVSSDQVDNTTAVDRSGLYMSRRASPNMSDVNKIILGIKK
jgi:hypothetical protein